MVTLKGHYIEKIEYGIIYLRRKNDWQILFFRNLEKKKLLSAYMENMLNGEKSIDIKQISVNYHTTWENF